MANFHAADLWVAVVPDTSKVGPEMEKAGKEAKDKFGAGVKGIGKDVNADLTKVGAQAKETFGKAGEDAGLSFNQKLAQAIDKQGGSDFHKSIKLASILAIKDVSDAAVGIADKTRAAFQRIKGDAVGAFEGLPKVLAGAKLLGIDTKDWAAPLGEMQTKAGDVKNQVQGITDVFGAMPGKIGAAAKAMGGFAGEIGLAVAAFEQLKGIEGWLDKNVPVIKDLDEHYRKIWLVRKVMGDPVPEADKSAEQLRAIAKAMNAIPEGKKIRIEMEAPTQPVKDFLKSHGFNLEDLGSGKVQITADTKQAQDQTQAWKDQLEKDPAKISIDADTTKADSTMRNFIDEWSKAVISVGVQPQGPKSWQTTILPPGAPSPTGGWGSPHTPTPAVGAPGAPHLGWHGAPPPQTQYWPGAPAAPAEPAPSEPAAPRASGGGYGGGGGSGSGGGGGSHTIPTPTDRKGLHAAGNSVANLYAFANSLVGTPYSQDLRDDCSGMVAKLANVALGLPPVASFSTANEEQWLMSHGFEPGLGAPGDLNIGWHIGGPGGGHTAATLPGGVHAESGGSGGGFRLGGPVGAESSQFEHHAHLAMAAAGAGDGGGAGPAGTQSDPVYTSSSSGEGETLGKGIVTGMLQALGLDGSVFKSFTGKGPLDWGITKLGTGLINELGKTSDKPGATKSIFGGGGGGGDMISALAQALNPNAAGAGAFGALSGGDDNRDQSFNVTQNIQGGLQAGQDAWKQQYNALQASAPVNP